MLSLSLIRAVFLAAAILGTSTLAAPTSDAPAPSTTSNAASADMVVTPHGIKPSANVHAIPVGGAVRHVDNATIHVLDAAGAIHKVVTIDPAARKPTRSAPAARAMQTGWVADANWMNTGVPIGSFKTTWTVPPAPATDNGQVVFLFNSIEPATFDGILQPVVQWGQSAAGGGPNWSVASWYLHDPITFFTPLVDVNEGDVLDGEMDLVGTNKTTGLFDYFCAFTNIPGTNATIHGAEELAWATITLEAYSLTAPSDYPTGATVFSSTNLELSSGEFPTINWATSSDPADGISTTVDVDGSTAAQITIQYPQ